MPGNKDRRVQRGLGASRFPRGMQQMVEVIHIDDAHKGNPECTDIRYQTAVHRPDCTRNRLWLLK